MSSPTYALPPFQQPHITILRTPSPAHEETDAMETPIPGVELIISGLPRSSVTSAAERLRAVVGEYDLQHSSDPLIPLRIIPGDERNPVDYVFASVDPAVTRDPRPDLLETTRRVFASLGLHADWKVARGPDLTRRVHFQMHSFAHAEAIQPRLSVHLNRRRCHFQRTSISRSMNHITYDLLDRASVDALFKQPPIIDHETLYPSVPCFIQPLYGLEVCILGLEDVIPAASVIDRYIRTHYGDVIAASRMALGGGAYCVVFNTWAQTSRFLSDPFTALDSGFAVSVSPSRPALLYVLNSSGLPPPTQSVDPIGASLRQLQDRFGSLRRALDSLTNTLGALVLRLQQEQTSQQSSASFLRIVAPSAGLSNVVSCSAQLQTANSRLGALQSDRRTSLILLTVAPPDRTDMLTQRVQAIEADISAQQEAVLQAQGSLAAAQQRFLSVDSLFSPPAQL